MKKEVLAVIAAVLAIWFFIMGFEVGSYKERKDLLEKGYIATEQSAQPAPTSQTTQPTQSAQTTQPTQSAQSTQSSQQAQTDQSAQPTQSQQEVPQVKSPASLSTAEILSNVSAAMNNLKAEQNFTADRTLTVTVNILDCSVPSFTNQLNDIVSGITGSVDPQETLVFANGLATNSKGEQVTPMDTVPPERVGFTLTPEGVSSATAVAEGDNIVYTIMIVSESTTVEAPVPPHHGAGIGYLDIATLGLPSIVKLTNTQMNYPGSTVKITVNKDGKVVGIDNYLPMNGYGEAKVLGVTGNATFEGSLVEIWKITY